VHKRLVLFVSCAAVISLLPSCGEKIDPMSAVSDTGGGQITYTEHIKPILDMNCIRCHTAANQGGDRNGAPPDVNLDTYNSTVEVGLRANARIQAGTMPPGTGGIPSDERALFQGWIDQGMPE